jgi:predicted ATPase
VRLGALSFLVGRNGAGKSNFLDALRFVSDALRTSLDEAMRGHGSVDDLRFRSAAADSAIGLRFELALPDSEIGTYTLRLAPRQFGGYAITEETCIVEFPHTGASPAGFTVKDGVFGPGTIVESPMPADRLYLPISPLHYVRPVYNVLTRMAFYRPLPTHMRRPNIHDDGALLLPDGSNCASVLLRLAAREPQAVERIGEYLQAIVPDLLQVRGTPIGGYDVLQFYQGDLSRASERPFTAESMSDGTLHALAVLTALFQAGFGDDRAVAAVGIEEPETALHPAASAVLRDAFSEIAALSQLIVTTQSADLLDDEGISEDAILAAVMQGGATTIDRLAEGQRSIIMDHLATAGELLRTSNFQPAQAEQMA